MAQRNGQVPFGILTVYTEEMRSAMTMLFGMIF